MVLLDVAPTRGSGLGRLRKIGNRAARHIWRHRVRPEEVQAAWDGDRHPLVRLGRREGFPRLEVMLRVPQSGRILFVVVERRPGGVLRVVTARDVTLSEKRRYLSQL